MKLSKDHIGVMDRTSEMAQIGQGCWGQTEFWLYFLLIWDYVLSQKSILPDRLKVLIRPDLAQIELSLLRQNLFTAFLA